MSKNLGGTNMNKTGRIEYLHRRDAPLLEWVPITRIKLQIPFLLQYSWENKRMPLTIGPHMDHFASQLYKGILMLSEPLHQETGKWKFYFLYCSQKGKFTCISTKWTNLILVITICSSFCQFRTWKGRQLMHHLLTVISQYKCKFTICGTWYKSLN